MVDVVVRDDGEIDRREAKRVEQRGDLAPLPGGAAIDEQRFPVGETISVPAPWPMSTKKMRAGPVCAVGLWARVMKVRTQKVASFLVISWRLQPRLEFYRRLRRAGTTSL